MSILSIDFETRSTVELKSAGAHKYAEHPNTDIWCMAWAFDGEEPDIWRPEMWETQVAIAEDGGETSRESRVPMPLPERVVAHIREGGEVRAWNAQFERLIWQHIMVPRYGAPVVRMEQYVCSAAEAAAMSLPRALGQAASALGVNEEKDEEGYRLMLRMSRPRRINDDGSLVWWDVPDKVERLEAYCKQDVRTERSIVKALRRLTPREREVYLLDQRMNDRGIRCDRALVVAAQDIASIGIARANARLAQITGGDVTEITNHNRVRAWLTGTGVETESVAKKAIAEMLERPDLPADAREVLELRSDAGRSSIAKLDAMLSAICDDAMLRGLLLYHAASTGRWAGRLVQPQNFPRGEVKNVEQYIDMVLRRAYDEIDLYAHPIVVLVSMLRSMLTAREGMKLVAGDFAAIEARVLNWLAGQDDVCEMFRQYDRAAKKDKPKFDPYRNMAVKMGRGIAPELVTAQDRQAGKAAELGCGFGMGWKKFITAAWDVYQVRVNALEAQDAVNIYRGTHGAVKQFWTDAGEACLNAVRTPGVAFPFGARKNLRAFVAGTYLYISLPSKRTLMYAAPTIEERETPWGEMKDSLHFLAPHPKTKVWCKQSAYGGLIVENIVQAVARDLLAEALLRLEERGYIPVLSVHDEGVCEVPIGFGSPEEMERIMSELPAWGEGCPVAAEAWEGQRYRK